MSKEIKSLKLLNAKYLYPIVIIDVVIIWLVFHITILNFSVLDFRNYATTGRVLIALIPIFALVISNILSSDLKAKLIFLRWSHALPGCRAFSEHLKHDLRIDKTVLKSRVGKFPVNPREQNATWYRLLKKHEAKVEVNRPHQLFLLFRDAGAIGFIALVTTALAGILLPAEREALAYALIVFTFQYSVFAIAAQNVGTRLVTSVLAMECIY